MSYRSLALAALAVAVLPAQAAIGVNSSAFVYSESFDSLASAGTNAWVNDGTLAGWSLFNSAGAAATAYAADAGSSNTGTFRSYGASNLDERALGGTASGGTYFGSPVSGAVAGWIAASFANTGATSYDSFTVSFDGEQWRNGGNTSAQTMVLQYGFGSSFATVGGWSTPGGAFDFVSPVVGSSAAAVNGNAAGLVSGLGGTVVTTWAPGQTLWLRWVENNDVGNDHGLAIDNLRFSVTSAVPETGTWAMLLAGLALVGVAARRRA